MLIVSAPRSMAFPVGANPACIKSNQQCITNGTSVKATKQVKLPKGRSQSAMAKAVNE